MICEVCKDTGWVCENHPDVVFDVNGTDKTCCGGAGKPCKCNTANPPWAFGIDDKESAQ